jgi:hypothetical protein
MILSAEALDIVTYLKTAHGKFVSLAEISRRAGGKKRSEESPNWARNLISPLVDAGLIEVNSRGHYRVPPPPPAQTQPPPKPAAPPAPKSRARVIGDDYFPAAEQSSIVGGDYFPSGG